MSETTTADQIARSPRKLDRDTLQTLFNLMLRQPWLERRQAELIWTLEVCADLEEQSLLCDLLHRFTYLSAQKQQEDYAEIAKQICDIWRCSPETTTIVAINRSDYADSSQAISWLLKSAFAAIKGWKTTNFVSKMSDAVARAEDKSTIVLIDEFVGSGRTLAKAIGWFQEKLKDDEKAVTIHACALAAMEASRVPVEAKGVDFYASNWLRRGISDHFSGAELTAALCRMMRIESELKQKIGHEELKKYSFGYKRSESLYYFENGNPVNNVFPIFWWPELKDGRDHNPLLRRI